MRKIFSGLFSLVLIFGCLSGITLPAKAMLSLEPGITPDGLEYTILNDEKITIDGYSGSATEVAIPETIEGYPVTSIGWNAFHSCENLTSVTIPKSITSIAGEAFSECWYLKNIYITDIVAWCNISFENCSANPLYYAENLYLNNKLVTDLIIPEDITSIGNYAFYSFDSLTSITIPNCVTAIGDGVFEYCENLTSVIIPDSVTSIGESAFLFCNNLTGIWVDENNLNYSSDEMGVLFNKNKTELIQAPGKTSGTYVIPDTVTDIGKVAFYSKDLNNITIPNNVTNMGTNAFFHCDNLQGNIYDNGKYLGNPENPHLFLVRAVDEKITSCDIHPNTKFIGSQAFFSCDELVSVSIPNGVTSIGADAFRDLRCLSSVVIPNSVTAIEPNTFSGCSNLISVEIPNSVTSIGEWAFSRCDSLTSVNIPCGVTRIEDYVFYSCENLTNVAIPDSVTCIGEAAFAWCSSLISVTIPNDVTTIGDGAFSRCDKLTSITIPNSIIEIGSNVFEECNNLQYNTYDNGKYLGNPSNPYVIIVGTIDSAATSCDIHFNTKIIDSCTFYGCDKLTRITIPDSVISIGSSAFTGCQRLNDITIPDSVISIGCSAFSRCGNLTGVKIPNNITTIVNGLFFGSSLTNITIPKNVVCIENNAFGWISNFLPASIYFEGDAPEIGYSAFYMSSVTAYYPAGNDTWTEEVMQDYGGNIMWVPYEPYEPGDLDGVEGVDNRDVEYLLWYTLFPEDYPLPQAADFDRDGYVDNKDVEYLLWHTLFPEDYPL